MQRRISLLFVMMICFFSFAFSVRAFIPLNIDKIKIPPLVLSSPTPTPTDKPIDTPTPTPYPPTLSPTPFFETEKNASPTAAIVSPTNITPTLSVTPTSTQQGGLTKDMVVGVIIGFFIIVLLIVSWPKLKTWLHEKTK